MRQAIIQAKRRAKGAMGKMMGGLMLLAVSTSLMCLGAFSQPAQAATFAGATEVKLTAGDAANGDQFGWSVAISGDTAVVGAASDNAHQGSAYVFVRSGSTWIQQAQLTASDGAANDRFGSSVAISGDTAVVGAEFDDVEANPDQGSAYVFVRSGGIWTQEAHLTASGGAVSDWFGSSVAINTDTVVVGSSHALIGGNPGQGSAYVFTRSGSSWTQQAQLTASDGAQGDQFGVAVAISADTVVIGASFDDVGAYLYQGSAYVFTGSGSSWTQQAQLTASDGTGDDWFGSSVAISGDTAVVGAHHDHVGGNPEEGSAYVYTRSGSSWTQQAQLNASDGAALDWFGCSVAISGSTVLVGARQDDVGGNTDQGSAYVYAQSGTTWSQQARLNASDGGIGAGFGWSVAMSGNTAVVGAEGAGGFGAAYVYEPVASSPAQVSAIVTLQVISVTIPTGYPTEVNYGVMITGTEAEPATYGTSGYHYLSVRNDGSGAEDLLIKGANATCGGGTWALAATPAGDQYSHLFGVGQAPATYSALSTTASTLSANVAPEGMADFNLKIQTPTSSTIWGQYTTTVSVLAVAAS